MIPTEEDIDDARTDLHGLLDAIEREMGRDRARTAATAVRDAAEHGDIDGGKYYADDYEDPTCPVCVLGTLGRSFGMTDTHIPAHVPGYIALLSAEGRMLTFERLILAVTPGETPATSPALAALVRLLDEWFAAHPAAAVTA